MLKTTSAWQIAGFIFTSIAGVLLHFLFDRSENSVLVALFSAVNESIWEHLKLLFFPMFIFAILQSRFSGKEHKNFWCVKLTGSILGIVFIPVLYYTINGIFGSTPDWVNIAIFFIVAFTSYFTEKLMFKRNIVTCKSPKKAIFFLCLIAVIFFIFTFKPPHLPLFEDPITKTYGYIK